LREIKISVIYLSRKKKKTSPEVSDKTIFQKKEWHDLKGG
jgi:hypothetical protein